MKVNTNTQEVGVVKEIFNACAELKAAGNMRIEYSLMEAECAQNVYFITLNSGNETGTVFAGNDENNAKHLFNMLVNGEVTPCTVEDVTRDYFQVLCEEK